jgi:proline dehydrogenase
VGLLIRFARQWVAGERLEDAVRAAKDANGRGLDAVVNRLGEHYHEEAAVEATVREYLELVARMDEAGVRGDISVKPTQMGVFIDRQYALSRFLGILDAVKASSRLLWLDMEAARTIDDTLAIYLALHRRYDKVGLAMQANVRRTETDLLRLLEDRARIRLVKGAYKEPPDVAFPTRAEIDAAYLRHLQTLFEKGSNFAVATHDGRMINRALELSKTHDTPFEFAMLQGVRDPLKVELASAGHRVADYIPYGPEWLAYFTRRLRERPRNIVTMVRSFVSG